MKKLGFQQPGSSNQTKNNSGVFTSTEQRYGTIQHDGVRAGKMGVWVEQDLQLHAQKSSQPSLLSKSAHSPFNSKSMQQYIHQDTPVHGHVNANLAEQFNRDSITNMRASDVTQVGDFKNANREAFK